MVAAMRTGRVVHGGYPLFRELAPRIEQAVGPGDLPILTVGAKHLETPARYWFYNTEPLHVARKRTPRLMSLLDGAERVLDYSARNAEVYSRSEFKPVALGPVPSPPEPAVCEIDILFYGLVTERRRGVLDALQATVVDRVFGAALEALIQRSRLVLCVNAWDERNGNPLRAFPALEYGARLVAERCEEEWYNRAIEPHATVVPYELLIDSCRRLLDTLEAA